MPDYVVFFYRTMLVRDVVHTLKRSEESSLPAALQPEAGKQFSLQNAR